MKRPLICLMICLHWSCWSASLQAIQPAEGSWLNYRHVWFEWEKKPKEKGPYRLQISQEDGFTHLLVDIQLKGNHYLDKENLHFNQDYYWRVIHEKSGRISETYFFSIGYCSKVDSAKWRHEVILDDPEWAGESLICVDKPGVIIDRKGQPVWFHPDTHIVRLFDLRVQENGHITYLRPKGRSQGNENLLFEEITLDGKLIWQAPDKGVINGDTVDRYHHEYQILKNGHYLIAGDEFLNLYPEGVDGPVFCRMGNLMEFDPQGKLVWSWKSQDHIPLADIFANGLKTNPIHLNGFYFQEESELIFVSFRYLDMVVLIDKRSGEILETYGQALSQGQPLIGKDLFHQQHSPHEANGMLWLYDNGLGKGADTVSAVVKLDLKRHRSLRQYRMEFNFGSKRNSWSESKGDVDIISNDLALVCMGALPHTMVVDIHQKKYLWHCKHWQKIHPEQPWMGLEANYRADISTSLYPQRQN